MAVKFKSLAQPDLLKRIQPRHLVRLLDGHRMFFEMKGFDGPQEAEPEVDYLALAGVLAQPDEDMPGELVEALHLISVIGTDDRFDELLDLGEANPLLLSRPGRRGCRGAERTGGRQTPTESHGTQPNRKAKNSPEARSHN